MLRKLGIVGLAVPLAAVIAALIYLLLFGETEPTFVDATQQLAQDHTVYALDLDERPAALVAPFGADPAEPLPLIIALHEYRANVWEFSQVTGLIARINADRFLLLLPNAARDRAGDRFWNATAAAGADAAYIRSLLSEAAQWVAFAPVYAVGQGNGAMMAKRLACESLPDLAAIVAVAGASSPDDAACRPPAAVGVLETQIGPDEQSDAEAFGERIVGWLLEQEASP